MHIKIHKYTVFYLIFKLVKGKWENAEFLNIQGYLFFNLMFYLVKLWGSFEDFAIKRTLRGLNLLKNNKNGFELGLKMFKIV